MKSSSSTIFPLFKNFIMELKIVLVFTLIITLTASAPAGQSMVNPEEEGGYFEGDMILSNNEKEMLKSGLRDSSYRWPDRTVVYAISDNFDLMERKQIYDGITEIATKTCIQFREVSPDEDSENYIMVDNQRPGCNSEVGYQGRKQDLNLNANCFGKTIGRISHEFIHAIGFYHEQSRADRDDYVEILWENIKSGFEHNFDKYNDEEVNSFRVPYDYGSVMHYGKNFFSKNKADTIVPLQEQDDVEIGQRKGLSCKDRQKINKMYGCSVPKC